MKNYKILVVDDESDLELLFNQKFREKIKKGEISFLYAENGAVAVEMLKHDKSIDIVFSDINMPVLDGLSLLGKMKEAGLTHKTIMISAYGDISNIRTSMNRGAFDFVMKPIDFNDLEITLEKTIKETELQQEIKNTQKAYEEALIEKNKLIQNQNSLLEVKIKERTRKLEETQQQLIQKEKMASLGQLAAGVAHEINNPINFVSANVPPLKRNVEELHEAVTQKSVLSEEELNQNLSETNELLKGIEVGANRTAEIVKSLRSFSSLDGYVRKLENIHTGIENTLMLLNKDIEGKIEIIKEFNLIQNVNCVAADINQVFYSIILNAIQALKTGGKIQISTSEKEGFAQVKISNNGPAISEEILPHIFEPFFTTKKIGEGRGLGLSTAYGIVEAHHGELKVSSTNDQTEFQILLPL